ncbi:MAG TPA: GNAT family N-acetyltransferase [Dysgonomonas sp.]|nr:GNAT family N-acetyltransferase [Dysgonomonas sp.]
MHLHNDIIRLRALEPEDLQILYEWENDTALWIHGNTLSPYSRMALRQYISDTQQQDIYQAKQLRLMIESKQDTDNSVIGTIDLYDFDFHHKRAGIGILVAQEYRNAGIASQALNLIREYAFSFLHIHQLYAYIAQDNEFSIRLFEKCGYNQCGLLEDWIVYDRIYKDVYIYQLISEGDNR